MAPRLADGAPQREGGLLRGESLALLGPDRDLTRLHGGGQRGLHVEHTGMQDRRQFVQILAVGQGNDAFEPLAGHGGISQALMAGGSSGCEQQPAADTRDLRGNGLRKRLGAPAGVAAYGPCSGGLPLPQASERHERHGKACLGWATYLPWQVSWARPRGRGPRSQFPQSKLQLSIGP